MKSRAESSRAGGQQKMEGVNMPASFKFAWRRLVGATAAAIFVLAALPGVGHTENIEICIGAKGKVKGINLGSRRMQQWSDAKSIGSPLDRPDIPAWRAWSETPESRAAGTRRLDGLAGSAGSTGSCWTSGPAGR